MGESYAKKLLVVSVITMMLCGGEYCPASESGQKERAGVIHKILLYIPNRMLDVIDIARCRLRVGPGLGVGARATEAVDVYAGSYVSVYAGLPGPRCRKLPRLPIGLESKSGVEVSVADATTGLGMSPDYSPTEFGADMQLLVVGLDVGIDPFEILDLAAGILFLDPRKDDL